MSRVDIGGPGSMSVIEPWVLELIGAVVEYESAHGCAASGSVCFDKVVNRVPPRIKALAEGYARGLRDARRE